MCLGLANNIAETESDVGAQGPLSVLTKDKTESDVGSQGLPSVLTTDKSELDVGSQGPLSVLTKACRDLQRQISSLNRLQSASSSRTSCAVATIHAAFEKLRTV